MTKNIPTQEDIKQDLIEIVSRTIKSKKYRESDSKKYDILYSNLMEKSFQNVRYEKYAGYLYYFLSEGLDVKSAVKKTLDKKRKPSNLEKAIDNGDITKNDKEIVDFFEYKNIKLSKIKHILENNFNNINDQLGWLDELKEHIDIYCQEEQIYRKDEFSKRKIFHRKPRNEKFIDDLKSARKFVSKKIEYLKDKRNNEKKDKSQQEENKAGEGAPGKEKGKSRGKGQVNGDEGGGKKGRPIKTKKTWGTIQEIKRVWTLYKKEPYCWENEKIIEKIKNKESDEYYFDLSPSTIETYATADIYKDFD